MVDSLVPAPPGEPDRPRRAVAADPGVARRRARPRRAADASSACTTRPYPVGVPWIDAILLREPESPRGRRRRATATSSRPSSATSTWPLPAPSAGRPLLVGGGISSTIPLDAEGLPQALARRAADLRASTSSTTAPAHHAVAVARRDGPAHLRHGHPAGHRSPCTTATTSSPRRSPTSRCATASSSRPLIDRVMSEAGVVRQDLTADRRRRRARARSPGCGSGWSRPARSAFVLEIPVYGVCSLDVARGRGRRHRRRSSATSWSPPTRAARRSTSRRTTTRAAASTGPAVLRPADAATDLPVAGEGPRLYPDAVPARRRAGPARAPAGWPARSPTSAPRCSTPSRSTCAVRTPTSPGSPRPPG